MFSAIGNLIGSRTGVNSAELIRDLLEASRQPKEQAIFAREQQNQASISALAAAQSSLDTFSEALTELLNGRAFAGNLISSDPSLVTVDFSGNSRPEGLPVSLEIQQIASAQKLASTPVADAAAPLGAGRFTIASSLGDFDIDLVAGSDSLTDLATAINQTPSGISAITLTDNSGSRLVLEGAEGAGETFSISGDFQDFNYPAGSGTMEMVATAADAFVNIDGINLQYSSNQIQDAIPGITISLNASSPGASVTVSGDRPISGIQDLITDFVAAFNDLRSALNDASRPSALGSDSGPLAGDSGVRDMKRLLGQISSQTLVADGPYRTLSDIGVRTNNDGTLSVDEATLENVLEADASLVSMMIDPAVPSETNPGLAGVVQSIRDRLQSENGSLNASRERLDRIAGDLAEQREELAQSSERYEALLQRNFANMDRQLVALQATQSYLTQQIAIWNGDNN